MTRRTVLSTIAVGLAAIGFTMILASAHVAADDDEAILVKSLGAAKVSLQDGFAASERQGQPVSGKFEAEEGKLQLSVLYGQRRKVL
ncbi:hypothetical protein [Bradyrhizobium sp. BR 1433]|uniref:hypothetical protein n=1 Tax=Bradyrhizobium sp. BR 1433 TaxID=3447967 RepID=UPI003EE62E1B